MAEGTPKQVEIGTFVGPEPAQRLEAALDTLLTAEIKEIRKGLRANIGSPGQIRRLRSLIERRIHQLNTILLDLTKRGISKDSMEFTAQDIIDRATVANLSTGVASRQPHPEPDTRGALKDIVDEATHLDDVLTELRERGIPLSTPEAEVAVRALHEIATRSAVTAWRLGLHAVDRDLMSQRKLAGLLDASNQTVNRRYRHGVTKDEEGKIARSDERTLPL
jgi:hypothetical protein